MTDYKKIKKLLKNYNVKILYFINMNGKRKVCFKRFGMYVDIDEDDIKDIDPYKTIKIILRQFRLHPEYRNAVDSFVKELKEKNKLVKIEDKTKSTLPKLVTIDDKKRRIREYLIEEGILIK